ncbi:unnamed protein product [Lactuca virosa]|uniref:RRM domain-containing protein n=1 Tax=Lactuca virosa TaxID=75947 RepID=A0AAU9MHP1_9ASTR|nr:unnamed protein product [Lactuca virosa]
MEGSSPEKRNIKDGQVCHLTNIYVEGFHGGTNKSELWSLFSDYGQVANVYMGGKRDSKKMNFAFVRFKGVKDEKEMEIKLQGTMLKERPLVINLSRHPRKSPILQQTRPNRNIVRRAPPPPQSGTRDGRSFAQVASGRGNSVQMMPITINSTTVMKDWLKKSVLIGETHSFDHTGNLPVSLLMNEGTKYIGGLSIALHFDSSPEASEFLNDNTRWRDWFKQFVRADQHEIPYERTAWLKILGLPLHLWDEENFNVIAGRFGRIVTLFNKLFTRRDYSMGKVGVLMSERKWINTEVNVVADGKTYKIGVVEFIDDWSPSFKFFNSWLTVDGIDQIVNGIKWNWSSCPTNVGLTIKLENLKNAITTIRLLPGPDEIKCKLCPDGNYMVHMLRQKIDQTLPINNQQVMIKWSKLVPMKVTCLVWRAMQGRIPSAMTLSHRAYQISMEFIDRLASLSLANINLSLLLCAIGAHITIFYFPYVIHQLFLLHGRMLLNHGSEEKPRMGITGNASCRVRFSEVVTAEVAE